MEKFSPTSYSTIMYSDSVWFSIRDNNQGKKMISKHLPHKYIIKKNKNNKIKNERMAHLLYRQKLQQRPSLTAKCYVS